MLSKLVKRVLGLLLRKLKMVIRGEGKVDEFLELVLNGMRLVFFLSRSYRKNIKGFKGKYLFRTTNNQVAASVIFNDGKMKVKEDAINDWDVRITFKNVAALRDLLFSQDQDILNALLKNEVSIDGNQNYIYRFGFLARDLGKRLGVV